MENLKLTIDSISNLKKALKGNGTLNTYHKHTLRQLHLVSDYRFGQLIDNILYSTHEFLSMLQDSSLATFNISKTYFKCDQFIHATLIDDETTKQIKTDIQNLSDIDAFKEATNESFQQLALTDKDIHALLSTENIAKAGIEINQTNPVNYRLTKTLFDVVENPMHNDQVKTNANTDRSDTDSFTSSLLSNSFIN